MRKLLNFVSVMIMGLTLLANESRAATVTPDAGWVAGTISSSSDVLPFSFTLTGSGVFSLTDCCTAGDVWTIFGDFVGVSTVGLSPITVPLGIGEFPSFFDPVWTDSSRSHFQIALGAGSYNISVSGNCGGGCEASFGVRVDTTVVPVPAAGLLLATALGGMMALRRRKSV